MNDKQRPRFKAHYHSEWVENEGIFLVSEQGNTRLHGRLVESVAPLIDGRRLVTEIIDQVQERVSAAEVYYVLGQLEQRGFLAESDDSLPAAEAAFWELQGLEPRTAACRLAQATVSVSAFGAVLAEPLRSALPALHVREGEPGQLGVVLTDHYLHSRLPAYNRQALATQRPWLLLKPAGARIWIGPLFRPGQTGCWECLAQRLRVNRAVECYLQKKTARAEPIPVFAGSTAATLQIAANLAATEVAKWLAQGGTSDLEGKLLTLDVRTWQTQTHTLVRLPQCPACGRPEECLDRPTPPLVLRSGKKIFTQDGGHRSHSPEETLQRYQHHVSPITGAVSMLERSAPSGDGVLHVYVAGENYARRHQTLEEVRRDLRSSSCGKGTTDAQAKASGLCEALERSCGIFRGDEPRRRARFADLGAAGIHPNACMLYSARQYEQRDAWNARQPQFNRIPVPFDDDAPIEWTPVWSLTRQQVCYLPTAFCYYAYPIPAGGHSCHACSNGNAAGNTPEEAILQGFLELVERDSVALWWYNRVARPAVDLDSFAVPYLGQLTEFLASRGRNLWVLDLTSDLQIPTFVALSRRTDQATEQILFGFGAHLDARVALLRAVTELNQMLAWVLPSENGQEPLPLDDREIRHWLETATLANQPYLAPATGVLPRKAADYPRRWADDLRDDVLACQALVAQHGMEMLVLDQTRADVGLPVVKVIVPGLRHFWARFAPGRLYDVPAEMGWVPRPRTEEQLNPIPIFI